MNRSLVLLVLLSVVPAFVVLSGCAPQLIRIQAQPPGYHVLVIDTTTGSQINSSLRTKGDRTWLTVSKRQKNACIQVGRDGYQTVQVPTVRKFDSWSIPKIAAITLVLGATRIATEGGSRGPVISAGVGAAAGILAFAVTGGFYKLEPTKINLTLIPVDSLRGK